MPVGSVILEYEEPFPSQGLCGEGSRPRTIHPELVRIPSVGLYHNWIPLAHDIFRRPIEAPLYFIAVRILPSNFFDASQSKIPEPRIQIHQEEFPAREGIDGDK